MQPIQFSEPGIQVLLQNLEANKSPGPDKIYPLNSIPISLHQF